MFNDFQWKLAVEPQKHMETNELMPWLEDITLLNPQEIVLPYGQSEKVTKVAWNVYQLITKPYYTHQLDLKTDKV